VQLLVVGFEKSDLHGRICDELLRASDTIRLVDAIIVRKDENGDIGIIQQSDLSTEAMEAAGAYISALIGLGMEDEAVAGAKGRLRNEVHVWYVADTIPPGTAAAIALIEHRRAIPLRSAIIESGGQLLADAWIHPVDLVEVGLLAGEVALA